DPAPTSGPACPNTTPMPKRTRPTRTPPIRTAPIPTTARRRGPARARDHRERPGHRRLENPGAAWSTHTMSEIRITRVDPTDETALLEWNDLMRLGYTESRTGAWWRSAETTLSQFARPRADRRDIPVIASLGGTVIGGAEINLSTEA